MLKCFFSLSIVSRKVMFRRFWLAALASISFSASAQAVGLRVVTTNDQNQPVTAVTVQLKLGGRLIAVEPTDDTGAVQFDNLKPGAYEIIVSKDGFETLKKPEVIVAYNTSPIVEFALIPRLKVSEQIEIKATDASRVNPIEQGASPSTDLRREQAKETTHRPDTVRD